VIRVLVEIVTVVVVVATLIERSFEGAAEVAFSPRDTITPIAIAEATTSMKSNTDTRPWREAISGPSGRTLGSSPGMVSLFVRAGW
jgi:hypothetical protein